MNEQQLVALVERVEDTLDPDVEVLVAAGAARGRWRQRRRRAAVGGLAAAAVTALLGVATLAVAGDSGPPVATDPAAEPSAPPVGEPRTPIAREDVPAAFASLFPGDVTGPFGGEGPVTDFRWNGYWVRVVIAEAVLRDLDPAERCMADSGRPSCVVLADGTAATGLSWMGEPRARKYQSAEGYTTDGFDVSIVIGNASGSKSGVIRSRDDELRLTTAVASDVWFD